MFPLRTLLLLALLVTGMTATAEVQTLIREYTYNASETDSKVSARKAALQQLQVLLIEEVGIQVQSTFSNTETLDKEAFSRTVQANYQTFAQALTRTRIIEERWDGEHFYIKAEVEVDPDGISQQMISLQQPPATDPCLAGREQAQKLLNLTPSPDKNTALIELAASAPIDSDCHDWQYSVLSNLSRSRYPAPGYRAWVFQQLQDGKPHELARLLPAAMALALRESELSKEEWQQSLSSLQRMEPDRVQPVLRVLSDATIAPARNEQVFRQPIGTLEQQWQQLLTQATAGSIATPALSRAQLAAQLISTGQYRQPELAAALFRREADHLEEVDTLVKPLLSIWRGQQEPYQLDSVTGQAFRVLLQQLSQAAQPLSANNRRELYFLLPALQRTQTAAAQQALDSLLTDFPTLFAAIIAAQPVNEVEKNLWFIRYNLPDSPACRPVDCAQQLFSDDPQPAQQASQYLLAYGERASPAADSILRKLERVKIEQSSTVRTQIKRNLIQLLPQLQPADARAIPLLVGFLNDFDHEIPDHAAAALIALHKTAVVPMATLFGQQPTLVQRRMLKAFAGMPADDRLARFLKSVKPADQHMQFALEDALAVHQKSL
ncbi:hypothetical protein [Venatoribacter cucullus]|uniref:hypothetical protein n=1 Tax=Venatoribacter cucullus TaxID=2661630 RepID=UPI0022402A21|nr:hypothetical protein [Venatoribacter cucullus]UZK03652.1 hypothetical protein GAY96_06960 [Venatoribacter cucullus]